ncbi:Phosphoserine phosphatase, chloroplastic [Tetrabaena socialis]|uniref:phosphoserine phosphatase n=1 Tax=Tetrabaena socialis TaxID=47790 RepID=A0A2J7ZZY4_9CHLO|nr:Phosphoserine phosphatase, chloroplastic [Tetrabaena socialis]|eukprot:PNH05830.1 Phosphoserine phosphatase, chloroplastic [Tetrabaena socialis]
MSAAAQPVRSALELLPEVAHKLRTADAVCFDVDSTFCEDESIDELAAFLGVGEQVAALTAQAMGGSVEFKEALRTRLGAMQPSRAAVDRFLSEHPHRVTRGIPQLVALLRSRGQQVFLVSGGFRQIIHPLAESLGIPLSHVFANSILFGADGAYAGFDEAEFTCRSGGKPAAIRHLKDKYGFQGVVMVGDGATDAEARTEGAASLFIGYGGVVVRQNVAERADWYVMDVQQIIDALSH